MIPQFFKVITLAKYVLIIPGIKLEPALQNANFVINGSCYPHDCKTGHFMLWKEQELLKKRTKMKTAHAKHAEILLFIVIYANL